jgi:hypothetical protein
MDKLHFISEFLLKNEIMDGEQFKAAMEGTPTFEELEEMTEAKKRRSREENDERRRQEDLVFNKVLVCFAGAVVYEMVAIFLQRFFVNYNQMSIEAVQFAMAIGNVLGLLRFVAPVLMIAAIVWGVARNKKQKSVFLPVLLTVAGALLTFTAFMAYYFRGVGGSVLGAVAPVGVALTILFFLYQKEFFFSGIFVGMGIAALWVYRKAYLSQSKMVLAGFVAVWIVLAVAALLAWKKCPLMVCVLAAIAADLVLYLFI